MAQGIDIPSELPVIILARCLLFPQTILPLFIFEPRYRTMLSDSLSAHRMFCIGNRLEGAPDDSLDPSDISPVSTAGLVRACVQNPDGTSNLILQGVARVKFNGWLNAQPYPVAKVVPLESTDSDPPRSKALAETLVSLIASDARASEHTGLSHSIECATPPGEVADLVAHHLISEFAVRQQILETLDTPQRLELVVDYIRRILQSDAPPQ